MQQGTRPALSWTGVKAPAQKLLLPPTGRKAQSALFRQPFQSTAHTMAAFAQFHLFVTPQEHALRMRFPVQSRRTVRIICRKGTVYKQRPKFFSQRKAAGKIRLCKTGRPHGATLAQEIGGRRAKHIDAHSGNKNASPLLQQYSPHFPNFASGGNKNQIIGPLDAYRPAHLRQTASQQRRHCGGCCGRCKRWRQRQTQGGINIARGRMPSSAQLPAPCCL